MSKRHVNWVRTPNSQMDRKKCPKRFFRSKNRVEDFDRVEDLEQKRLLKICERAWEEKEKENR